MERRAANYRRDVERLLAMQRVSWEINFAGRGFRESSFRMSLRAGIGHGDVFVYEDAGEIVGWLWLDRYDAGIIHIRHIQVARDHWGRGIGRRIMEDAIATAQDEGRSAVTLNVTKSNARAVHLYESLGFRVISDEGERQRMKLDVHGAATRVGRHRDRDVNGSEEESGAR